MHIGFCLRVLLFFVYLLVGMADDLYRLLDQIDLAGYHSKLRDELQVTRIGHFEHVEMEDLLEIGLSKSQSKRLLNATQSKKQNSFIKLPSLFKRKPELANSGSEQEGICDDAFIIPSSELKMLEIVGSGVFGQVYRAIWSKSNGTNTVVAAKSAKTDGSMKRTDELLKEVAMMTSLQHPNLIKLHGVSLCSTQSLLVVEFAPCGNLLNYLKLNSGRILITQLIHFATQLASALDYLESCHCIHRDVAARNCLLVTENHLKLGDFGLSSRRFASLDDEFSSVGSSIPFAWAAPEMIKNGEFSFATDTWMFGVLCWELFTFGERPWQGVNASQLLAELEQRKRLKRPRQCPIAIYQMMLQCWRTLPENRPTFEAIGQFLKQGFILKAQAHQKHHPANGVDEDLIFNMGDTILLVEAMKHESRWYGQNVRTRKFGYFPSQLVHCYFNPYLDYENNNVYHPTSLSTRRPMPSTSGEPSLNYANSIIRTNSRLS